MLFVLLCANKRVHVETRYVARRTLTTSSNQPPTSGHHHDPNQQQQQQQHTGSNAAHGIFNAVNFAPKSNIEKSLQQQQQHQYQTPRNERQTNCSSDSMVCRCSPEGDAEGRVQTTTSNVDLHNICPPSNENCDHSPKTFLPPANEAV